MIKVLIVDDHKIVADGIQMLLDSEAQVEIVGICSNGLEATKLAKEIEVDVVLMDINMPEMNGIDACKTIKSSNSEIKIIALSNHQELAFIYNMVNAGADGYILKISGKEILLEAISKVIKGESYFSPKVKQLIEQMDDGDIDQHQPNEISLSKREKEILRLIVLGYTNSEISTKLFISKNTTDTHRKNLLRKLNVSNTAGLVRLAYETNILY